MANRFTRIIPTGGYQRSYRPLPLDLLSTSFQDIRQDFDTGRQQDAKTRLLAKTLQGQYENPVLKRGAQQVAEQFNERLKQRAEKGDYENMTLETQMDAQELAQISQEFQSTADQYQTQLEEFKNFEGVSPQIKNLLLEGSNYNLDFDQDRMRPTIQGDLPQLVEEADPVKIINERLSGMKTDEGVDIRGIDETTGKLVLENGEAVSEAEAEDLARRALASSPEFRASQNQAQQAYAIEAQNLLSQGVDPMELLKAQAGDKTAEQVNKLLSQAGYTDLSDQEKAALYSSAKSELDTQNAVGFAGNKFAFTKKDLDFIAPSSGVDTSGESTMDKLMRGVSINNAYMTDKPTELPSLDSLKNSMVDTGTDSAIPGSFGGEYLLPGGSDRSPADFDKMSPKELAQTEEVQAKFGDALSSLIEENPQRNESKEDYWNRISEIYGQAQQALGSINQGMRPLSPDEIEGSGSVNRQLFGNPNQAGDVGLASDLTYVISTPGEESEELSADQLADKLGFGDTSEMFNNLKAIGEFTEESPFTGYEMRVVADPSVWSSPKTYSIKGIVDEAGDDRRKAKLADIQRLKLDLGFNDPVNISYPTEKGSKKVIVKAENTYIKDGELVEPGTEGAQFAGRRLVLEGAGDQRLVEGQHDKFIKKIMDSIQ